MSRERANVLVDCVIVVDVVAIPGITGVEVRLKVVVLREVKCSPVAEVAAEDVVKVAVHALRLLEGEVHAGGSVNIGTRKLVRHHVVVTGDIPLVAIAIGGVLGSQLLTYTFSDRSIGSVTTVIISGIGANALGGALCSQLALQRICARPRE